MDVRVAILRRWRLVPVLVADGLLAAALLAVALIELRVGGAPDDGAAVLILVAQSVVLVFRRRYPVAVWSLSGVLVLIYGVLPYEDPTLPYPALVAIYTVAAHTSARVAAVAGAVTALGVVVGMILDPRDDARDWLVAALSTSTAWLLGNNVRTNRAYAAALEARAERLERDRHEEARRAVADERLRLARELHDVAAHHVSVISLHAEAGQAVLPGQPAAAGEALATIADEARATLTDLRRVVGVLRDDSDAAPLAPQPGLGALEGLVRDVGQAGLAVTLAVTGEPRAVGEAVDASAYRIVQEALTNVLRHADAAHAEVVVRYEPDALTLEVLDDGHGSRASTADGEGAGHGLVGMRERVAAFGGSLSAADRPAGGFAVRARLPR